MRFENVFEILGMHNFAKVSNLILEATPVLGCESVPILDALRRVLAQDILVIEDVPAANISSVDGYAVRYDCLHGVSRQNPVHLRIIGESPAGKPFGASVKDGETVRIMTGGVVPRGADTVVRQEHASEENGYFICGHNLKRGSGIRFRGAHLRNGEIALRAGHVVGPLEIGVLATLRRAFVYVHRKPLVAIFSTGNELADFHEAPSPGKVMCSNLYTLAAFVMECGAVPLCLGIVADDLVAQQSRLSEALRADVIITSGGMSKGKYDLGQKAFAALGMDIKLSTVFMKPGKPTVCGTVGNTLVFGLPGGPSAVMQSFEQFVKPALLKMMGHRHVPRGAAQWCDVSNQISGGYRNEICGDRL